eukprot:6183344-Pleurochrysis_carterae.AAC.6
MGVGMLSSKCCLLVACCNVNFNLFSSLRKQYIEAALKQKCAFGLVSAVAYTCSHGASAGERDSAFLFSHSHPPPAKWNDCTGAQGMRLMGMCG